MGQARNAAQAACRPALRQRLSVRRDLPGPRRRGGPRVALRRHRHDAAPPRRNLAQRRRGRPRCSVLDRAGWHTTGKLDVPDNITPIFLPSRAPELNPVENVWQYLRQNWLSNTVFKTTTRSSTPHPPLGESSSLNPKRSRPSECATGLTSVSRYDPWYKALLMREIRSMSPQASCQDPEGPQMHITSEHIRAAKSAAEVGAERSGARVRSAPVFA